MGSSPSKSEPINNGAATKELENIVSKQNETIKQQNEALQLVREELSRIQGEMAGLKKAIEAKDDSITILHFNDVYNIEPRDKDPVGGAARFVTKLKSFKDENPLILFSGDAFNPSMMSTVTKGKQMPPCLNEMMIHTAVYGNHDFDFGKEILEDLAKECNFPWLISNVIDKETGRPLSDGIITRVFDWNGHKIGLMGLVEIEWLVTLATIAPEELEFTDFVECANKLSKELRAQGCEMIIALTHMRQPNDERLCEEAEDIDLVLGGHDHHYETKKVNGRWLFKSGTDFRDLTHVKVDFVGGKPVVREPTHYEITKDIVEDPIVKEVVDKYEAEFKAKMEQVVGNTEVALDGKFAHIRTRETNLGNFIVDIMVDATGADFGMLNSGTYRSDDIHQKGELKLKDLVSILPMADSLVVLGITGKQLLSALENSVSQFPKLEGRFAQVSGLSFEFDPTQGAGARVVTESILVKGKPLDLDKEYKMVTKSYLALGKDGYDVFKGLPVYVDEECGPVLPAIVRNHFNTLSVANGFSRRASISQTMLSHQHPPGLKSTPSKTMVNPNTNKPILAINPQVEGRIINLHPELLP
eukprot:Colp12_sorted_trinity150504_noHs@10225